MNPSKNKWLTQAELEEEARNIFININSDKDESSAEEPFRDSGSDWQGSYSEESDSATDENETNKDSNDQNIHEIDQDAPSDEDDCIDIEKDAEVFDFNEQEGPKVALHANTTPIEVSSLLFDDTLIDKIVR